MTNAIMLVLATVNMSVMPIQNAQHIKQPKLKSPVTELWQPIEKIDIKIKVSDLKPIQAKEIKPLKLVDVPAPKPQPAQPTQASRATSTAGNTYGYGYCTWYVKNQAPWIPNGLGNANTWASRAPSYGLTVSSVPRVGAVAQSSGGNLGHVALVTGVSGNSVTISEMNYQGWNVVSSRTEPISAFIYIY